MNIQFYSFSKKKNSTKVPSPADATTLTNCELKDETSTINPIIIIRGAALAAGTFVPNLFNYCAIPIWQRYYFITDWQYIGGIWQAVCTVDVLASHKAAIGNTTAYVERSASNYNGDIIDNLYPAKTDITISSATIATSWANVAPSGGCYILGVINYQPGGRVGAVTYYACTPTSFNDLLSFLFGNNIYNASNITEIGEGLFKSLFNPFQYFVSCMWLPGAASNYGSQNTTVKVGYWDTSVSAVACTALADVRFITGTIPDHPQISRGAYLNYAPYTRITLFCPPFGEVPIDASFTRTGKYLYAKVIVDPITGQATLRIAFRSGVNLPYSAKPCIEKTAMFGVPIQLAQVLSDYTGVVSSLSSIGSGGIVGAVTSIIGATVQSAINSQAPKVSTNGANGSFINFALEPNLVVEHTPIVDEDLADLGRPLMSTVTINTLSGYVKCAEAHFAGNCLDAEKDMVNQFMVNGFYYE